MLDDLGPGISIRKCKGHATAADVDAGRATHRQRRGNDNADHFAGRGAEIAESMSPTDALAESYKLAQQWYRWLAVLAAHWPNDTQDVRPDGPRPVPAPRPRRLAPEARPSAHELYRDGSRIRCKLCAAHAAMHSEATWRALVRSECRGPVPARVLAQERRHVLFLSGEVSWCKQCGSFSESRLRRLGGACVGGTAGSGARVSALSRLLRSRHPRTLERLPAARRLRVEGGQAAAAAEVEPAPRLRSSESTLADSGKRRRLSGLTTQEATEQLLAAARGPSADGALPEARQLGEAQRCGAENAGSQPVGGSFRARLPHRATAPASGLTSGELARGVRDPARPPASKRQRLSGLTLEEATAQLLAAATDHLTVRDEAKRQGSPSSAVESGKRQRLALPG